MVEKVKYSLEWSVDDCAYKGSERFDSQDELMERITDVIKKHSTDGEINLSVLEY